MGVISPQLPMYFRPFSDRRGPPGSILRYPSFIPGVRVTCLFAKMVVKIQQDEYTAPNALWHSVFEIL